MATTASFHLVFGRTTFLRQVSVNSSVPGTLIRFCVISFKISLTVRFRIKTRFYGARVTLLFVNIFGDFRVVQANFGRKLTFVFAVRTHNNRT